MLGLSGCTVLSSSRASTEGEGWRRQDTAVMMRMHQQPYVCMSEPLIQDRPIREFADRGESWEKYIYHLFECLSPAWHKLWTVLHFEFIVTKMHFISKAYAFYYLSVPFPLSVFCPGRQTSRSGDLESKALMRSTSTSTRYWGATSRDLLVPVYLYLIYYCKRYSKPSSFRSVNVPNHFKVQDEV